MTWSIGNGMGDAVAMPSRAQMEEMFDGLDPDAAEHGYVRVSDEEGNALEYVLGGILAFERADGLVRHIAEVSKGQVLDLWVALADGRLDEIEGQFWLPGFLPPRSPEGEALRQRELAEWRLRANRQFYEALGPNQPGERDHLARRD